jgi:hypothetical protein
MGDALMVGPMDRAGMMAQQFADAGRVIAVVVGDQDGL